MRPVSDHGIALCRNEGRSRRWRGALAKSAVATKRSLRSQALSAQSNTSGNSRALVAHRWRPSAAVERTKMKLPNQSNTWGRPIESFDAWRARQTTVFVSDAAAIGCYLRDQLRHEVEGMKQVSFNNPILGLLSHLGEANNRAQELLYAYQALTMADDQGPAQRVLAGVRLNPNLHPDYVERTRCYG